MKYSFLILLQFPLLCFSQQNNFPKGWVGNWKGELQWFSGNTSEPKKVNMELHIQPTDSGDNFTWQIIYGKASVDNRPYLLMPKDTAKGHWVIDENNGIVLDQYWVAGKLSGAFSVQNSTIINNYWMEQGKLYVEFYNISVKPVSTTGKGTDESPSVNSYQIKSYQKAVLQRSE
jgi:hypothetical protein